MGVHGLQREDQGLRGVRLQDPGKVLGEERVIRPLAVANKGYNTHDGDHCIRSDDIFEVLPELLGVKMRRDASTGEAVVDDNVVQGSGGCS